MLIEGPFESDYSLAIVNRRLALALLRNGSRIRLHQRDNTTHYPPGSEFLKAFPELAPLFASDIDALDPEIHSRYIYPPFTDTMRGAVNAIHCYGWEESSFPQQYVSAFNRDIDVITVMSEYVREVLIRNGVTVPITVTGLGVDHILEVPAEPIPDTARPGFRFVHVSSCFPRKGADALVEAFCREFRRGEPVTLFIKTFPNPHNNIEQLVAEASSRYPDHAPLDVSFRSYSQGQMRSLLENADCLVAPSRGEGFGLPAAEAMMLGTPVIATIHGGHADFCSPDRCWPVDFRLEAAQTHLSEGVSLWAEPDVDSLRRQMRKVFESDPDAVGEITSRAREYVRERFTWKKVAEHHADIWGRAATEKAGEGTRVTAMSSSSPGKLAFISTWNARCGIAEYTRMLTDGLSPKRTFAVFASKVDGTVREDEGNVYRCWTASNADLSEREIDEVADQIARAGYDTVSLQYNFGFMSPGTADALIRRLRGSGVKVIVTLHSTSGPQSEALFRILQNANGIVVHRREELATLKAAGLTRVHLQRQGIATPGNLKAPSAKPSTSVFVVSCFGFFLPPKGIYELINAFAAAAAVEPRLRLKLLNALYDLKGSHDYASECLELLERLNILDRVNVTTGFLDQNQIVAELADSDLVVLPYLYSTESSSAAIRLPLASLTPVLCSDLEIFREFSDIVHRYPAHDPVALANRLLELSGNSELLRAHSEKQRSYVADLAWSKVTKEFEQILDTCVADR